MGREDSCIFQRCIADFKTSANSRLVVGSGGWLDGKGEDSCSFFGHMQADNGSLVVSSGRGWMGRVKSAAIFILARLAAAMWLS